MSQRNEEAVHKRNTSGQYILYGKKMFSLTNKKKYKIPLLGSNWQTSQRQFPPWARACSQRAGPWNGTLCLDDSLPTLMQIFNAFVGWVKTNAWMWVTDQRAHMQVLVSRGFHPAGRKLWVLGKDCGWGCGVVPRENTALLIIISATM